VKAILVLVTNWDFELYHVPQFGKKTGGGSCARPVAGPRFVIHGGWFVCHTILLSIGNANTWLRII
jgi:hypothetical protein